MPAQDLFDFIECFTTFYARSLLAKLGMPAREMNPFTALTRIRSQFLRTQ